jgi:homoserine kinase
MKRARAFAPATVANVAVGFDILGFAIDGFGESVAVEKIENNNNVVIKRSAANPELPLDPEKNCATAGLLQLIKDKKLSFGFRVALEKRIPIGSGLGGSAASAVAAVVAANAILNKSLSEEEIYDYALTGEAVASGSRHGDNVGPALKGGLILVHDANPGGLISIPYPAHLFCVVILPDLRVETRGARKLLRPTVPLKSMVKQTANLSGFLVGSVKSDYELIRHSLDDVVIEPQRAKLIPGFYDLKKVATDSGALGFSISGSGPAMFALCKGKKSAVKVQQALLVECQKAKLKLQGSWVSKLSKKGARVVRENS